MNAVAPGLRADIDDRIARAAGRGIKDLVGLGDPDCHRVHKDVAIIGAMEIDLATNSGHAHAIAIAANATHHARDQVAHLWMIGSAKAQCIEVGNRPRAHCEHVAQDAANARRRALIGFDVGRVIVALHLEDRRLSVPDIDNAGIFAGPAYDLRAGGRQLLQVNP